MTGGGSTLLADINGDDLIVILFANLKSEILQVGEPGSLKFFMVEMPEYILQNILNLSKVKI